MRRQARLRARIGLALAPLLRLLLPRTWRWLTGHLLHSAAFMGDEVVLRRLLAMGADPQIREPLMEGTPLMSAAFQGQVGMARLLLEARAAVDTTNKVGSTALMYAAQGGNNEFVTLLLDAGASINAQESPPFTGRTALVQAASGGHLDTVRLLVERGARPDCLTLGLTAAQWTQRLAEQGGASWKAQRACADYLGGLAESDSVLS